MHCCQVNENYCLFHYNWTKERTNNLQKLNFETHKTFTFHKGSNLNSKEETEHYPQPPLAAWMDLTESTMQMNNFRDMIRISSMVLKIWNNKPKYGNLNSQEMRGVCQLNWLCNMLQDCRLLRNNQKKLLGHLSLLLAPMIPIIGKQTKHVRKNFQDLTLQRIKLKLKK